MELITIFISILLSLFSTIIMSYISMATPIGPWIAPTLVLIALLLFKLYPKKVSRNSVALTVSAGSIGGILATACGFSFPTLYFLEPSLFNTWMRHPTYFALVLTGLAFGAGWLGIFLANVCEDKLIVQNKLAFPIGNLVHKMLAAQQQISKAYELLAGFFGTMIFCALQDGIRLFSGIVPKTLVLVAPIQLGIFALPLIRFDVWPMVWAIGFVTGHVIAWPLALGLFIKIGFVDPLHKLFFLSLSHVEFILAFCSGMVLSGVLANFFTLPRSLWHTTKKLVQKNSDKKTIFNRNHYYDIYFVIELGAVLLFLFFFLRYFQFSLLLQIYLIFLTSIYAYQIMAIAGKIGLALLGRFATFVMLPALFLFNLDSVQLVFIATFVEVCGGVATDVLFGRKMARLSGINHAQVKRYQYLGLLVSAVSVGFIFWVLINQLHLGSPHLFAQRAQARHLLIHVHNFDYYVLAIGTMVGFILKYSKTNPMLVLGGLLMPINISLGLVIGGLLAYVTPNAQEWYPFWSGVFASNSIWILIKAIF